MGIELFEVLLGIDSIDEGLVRIEEQRHDVGVEIVLRGKDGRER
jgi:hypothetical protein